MKVLLIIFAVTLFNRAQSEATPEQLAASVAKYVLAHGSVTYPTSATMKFDLVFLPTSSQQDCFGSRSVSDSFLRNFINKFGPGFENQLFKLCKDTLDSSFDCSKIDVNYGKTGNAYYFSLMSVPQSLQSYFSAQQLSNSILNSRVIGDFIELYGLTAIADVLKCFSE